MLRGRCQVVRHREGLLVVAVPREKEGEFDGTFEQNQKVSVRQLDEDARDEAPLRLDSAA